MRSNFAYYGQKRQKNISFNYSDLEQRQLLATLTGFAGGELTLDLTEASDIAIVSVNAAGEVTVNGSRDMDSSTGATEVVLASSVSQMDVNGVALIAAQEVAFDGAFDLATLEATDINAVTFLGNYNISGDLTLLLEGNSRAVGDSTGSSLTVGGTTDINARNNDIVLHENIDFAGPVRLSTLGGFDATVSDINDLSLEWVDVSGDLRLTAMGTITDVSGSHVEARDAFLTAIGVSLGDNSTDTVNFFRSGFQVAGQVELHEDSNIVLLDSNMGSFVAESAGAILDGRSTDVNIEGNAFLMADFGVRLGEHGLDRFNAGSLTIQSPGHVHIFEDSGTFFEGSTAARTLDVTSLGDVRDDVNASIVTTFATGFEGDNVILGDSASDTLDLGGVYFWSLGDVEITEDGNIFVIDSKNRADRLRLSAPGFMIADDTDAKITVDRLATFVSDDVTIGGYH